MKAVLAAAEGSKEQAVAHPPAPESLSDDAVTTPPRYRPEVARKAAMSAATRSGYSPLMAWEASG